MIKPIIVSFIILISLSQNLFSQNKEIISDSISIISKYKDLGVNHLNSGDYKLALEKFIHAEEFAIILKDSNEIANLSLHIANLYSQIGNNKKALKKGSLALEIFKKIKNNKGVSNAYNLFGIISNENLMYKESIDYFKKSLKLLKNDSVKKIPIALNLGHVYKEVKDYKSALDLYNDIELILIKTNKTKTKYYAYLLMNFGELYFDKEEFEKALLFYVKANKITKSFKNSDIYALTLNEITLTQLKLNKLNAAQKNGLKALNILIESDYKEPLKRAFYNLSLIYKKTKNYKKSLSYYEKYVVLKDSILKNNNSQIMNNYETIVELEKSELEMQRIKSHSTLVKTKFENQKLWFLIILSIILIIMTLFLLKYKTHRFNESLVKRNLELVNFRDFKDKKMRYNNISLSEKQIIQIKTNLLNLMEKEKLFLEKNINAKKIADLLNTNTSYLSKVINIEFKKNFNSFINSYRIKEARELMTLQENRDFTIEYIASKSGFNSQSSFNKSFKLNTGLTPLYFKKSLKKSY